MEFLGTPEEFNIYSNKYHAMASLQRSETVAGDRGIIHFTIFQFAF